MKLTSGDMSVVSNLRYSYKDALTIYSDETLAKAWREFSQSDDYQRRDAEPNLFLEWVEMVHAE